MKMDRAKKRQKERNDLLSKYLFLSTRKRIEQETHNNIVQG
jgi:hypothetical protein